MNGVACNPPPILSILAVFYSPTYSLQLRDQNKFHSFNTLAFQFMKTNMPNFSSCSQTFIRAIQNPSLNLWEFTQFSYNESVNGPLSKINHRPRSMITLAGCRKMCGAGSDYYEWKDSSATITTWVLPVMGLLLQAPYESNELRRTLRALARWLGNPVASLSYTLWNIKASSKCALMVDMATEYEQIPGLYDEVSPGQLSQFSQIRDSIYILSVMNQCM